MTYSDFKEEMTVELYDELKHAYRRPQNKGRYWRSSMHALHDYFADMDLGDADPNIGDRWD